MNQFTPPTEAIAPGETIQLEVKGAFLEIDDTRNVLRPFIPESEGNPQIPIAGPMKIQEAEPGDSVVIELLALEPSGIGTNAILRNFAVLREEFAYPTLVAGPARDGNAWFGERIPIPFFLNLETVSTIPPDSYEPSHAGAYGGDFVPTMVPWGPYLWGILTQ